MRRTGNAYGTALHTTLRRTAAAYGYTLTIATTVAVLTSVRGTPRTGDVFLFVAGGLAAFGALDACALAFPVDEDAHPERALPFAGALNFVSVPLALGGATVLAHGLHSRAAWLLAPMAATAVYMLLVALQVSVIAALRR